MLDWYKYTKYAQRPALELPALELPALELPALEYSEIYPIIHE